MTTIGLELKICRIISGRLVKQVAREAGISRPQLSHIENGHILPIPEVEDRLKRIVGWTPAVHDFLQDMLAQDYDATRAASTAHATASELTCAAKEIAEG